MENLFGNIVSFFFVALGIIIITGVSFRLIFNLLSKEKQEKAVVANKQHFDKQIYRKNGLPFARKEYIVTVECRNKKRHFEVSELSYKNYKVGQKGILRYKGNRLIDFK